MRLRHHAQVIGGAEIRMEAAMNRSGAQSRKSGDRDDGSGSDSSGDFQEENVHNGDKHIDDAVTDDADRANVGTKPKKGPRKMSRWEITKRALVGSSPADTSDAASASREYSPVGISFPKENENISTS